MTTFGFIAPSSAAARCNGMELLDKLAILTDAAKYDAACTSSGSRRGFKQGWIGNTSSSIAGCCHTFSADGRCVTLLKVLMSNCCVYDCAYCVNRRSNDTRRAAFTPEELAEYTRELTAAHARRMDGHLRALYPGAAVLTTGGCMLCAACTRPAGRPCRHPEAVGYSLESLGCDVGAAARGELGWELLWPRRDKLPRYLTLLCAVLR